MCLINDKKFLNLISPTLERFAWKSANLANCRCPYCGDSQKNKRKARGYFYTKGNDMFFRCHNCGVGTTMYKFLEAFSPNLAKEYALERWRGGESGHSNYKKPELNLEFKKPEIKNTNILSELVTVDSLPNSHICKQYVIMRMIPEKRWSNLYYTDNFSKLFDKYSPEASTIVTKSHSNSLITLSKKSDERLVIPILNREGELIAMQGRALNTENYTAKYLTIKLADSLESYWHGIHEIDPNKTVYVVEGPIDSLFLPNSIAMNGLIPNKKVPEYIQNFVYVLDNEPRNKVVLDYYKAIIGIGYAIMIWPDDIKEKDINEMIVNNINIDDILNMIMTNTYRGLEAKMRFAKWKKA